MASKEATGVERCPGWGRVEHADHNWDTRTLQRGTNPVPLEYVRYCPGWENPELAKVREQLNSYIMFERPKIY